MKTSDWKPNPRLLTRNTTKFLNLLLLQPVIPFGNYHLVVLIKSIIKYEYRIRETSSTKDIYYDKYINIYIHIYIINKLCVIRSWYIITVHCRTVFTSLCCHYYFPRYKAWRTDGRILWIVYMTNNTTLYQHCKLNASTIYGVNVMKINSEFPLPSSLPQSIYWNETSGHPLAVINQTYSAE